MSCYAGCGCNPPPRFARAPGRRLYAPFSASRIVRAQLRPREQSTPKRARGTAPVVVQGKSARTQCRPFLKVEKDSTLFAACNALADELGPIDGPKKAFKLINEAIGNEVNEVFGLVTLDIHNRFKSLGETGRGEPDSVMAPLKPTFQAALIDGAHTIILFHVHPSGMPAEPSDADIETTEGFVEAAEVLDLFIMDHLIVAGDSRKKSYFSFAEEGLL